MKKAKSGLKTGSIFFSFIIGLLLAISFYFVIQSYFEKSHYQLAGVLIIGSFTLFPVLIVAVGVSVWHMIRKPFNARSLLGTIWIPSILILLVCIPFFSSELDKRENSWEESARGEQKDREALSRSNAPGPYYFIDLKDHAGLPKEAQEKLITKLFLPEFSKSKTSGTENLLYESDPNYDGYQLLEGNLVRVKRIFSTPEVTKVSNYKLTVPDYRRFVPIVRTSANSPATAWLWPKQVNTILYIYKDRVEAVLNVNPLDDEQYIYATQIEFNNYTGKNIARLKINGWDFSESLLDAKDCTKAAKGIIPALIANSLLIEWQVLGEDSWYSTRTENIPAEPKLYADQLRFGQGLHIMLGHDGYLALKRQLQFKLKDADTVGNTFSQEMPNFKDFDGKYVKCTPI